MEYTGRVGLGVRDMRLSPRRFCMRKIADGCWSYRSFGGIAGLSTGGRRERGR